MTTAQTQSPKLDPILLDRKLQKVRREVDRFETGQDEQDRDYRQRMAKKAEEFAPVFDKVLRLFEAIKGLDRLWRDMVFRGELGFSGDMDMLVRALFLFWGEVERHAREKAEYLARRGADFRERFDKLAGYARDGRQTLEAWIPPAVSSAPALRTRALSAEQAAKFRELLAD